MDIEYTKNILSKIGFKPKDGSSNIWAKKYSNNSYDIKIIFDYDNPNKTVIDYGNLITIVRNTITNFNDPENYVVLECVNRLLQMGYKPQSLVLEKDWSLGHKYKGYLDILVKEDDGKAYLMIECKTWGGEYNKEKAKILENGGQLFSYFRQEISTKYLCLYTSRLVSSGIEFENDIIVITKEIQLAKNQQDAFEAWYPQVFETKGLFEESSSPYNLKFIGILKKDLKELNAQDGGYIFNRFAEILRKNVVSDKTNAFNKIFNLFLCKIVDEFERKDNETMLFQWQDNEDNETVLLRLNDLYKRGMELYLNLKLSAVTEEELMKELDRVNTEEAKQNIRNLFIQQKLYTGNEFAFKEVFDKATFDNNCIVVKEVVKLLEKYKIKYSAKQQFLGDFFERLLNTGIKQEAGQFFTPIPITRFICKSIPVKEIIETKNNNREEYFLPYVIDFASGSGHFLTEIMSEIDKYIKETETDWIKGGGLAVKEFNSLKNDYLWAKEYIYGIEKDYRLAKTTKISTFLNGDGDANIICGDGLDNFTKSKDYYGKLKSETRSGNNENFDILIANPPYSVSGFKTTLKNGKESFNLIDIFTEKSKEIECLFIERAKQLVKTNGIVAIILPTSLLSNDGPFIPTRELIVQNFEVKGIVELGPNTFMATGTNTFILFLKKRDTSILEKIKTTINTFFNDFSDVSCFGIENVFSKYLVEVYPDLNIDDYKSIFTNSPTEKTKETEMYIGYKEKYAGTEFLDIVREIEKKKLLYFILTYSQKIVLVKPPEKINDEREFLGYKFSDRNREEGIIFYTDEHNHIVTKLFDEENLDNSEKVNYYILKAYNDQFVEVSPSLSQNLRIQDFHKMIDFKEPKLSLRVLPEFINEENEEEYTGKWPLKKLGGDSGICEVKIGGTPSRRIRTYFQNGNNLWVSIGELRGQVIEDTEEKITDEGVRNSNVKLIAKGTTLLSFKLSIGKTGIAGRDLYTNEAIAGLEIKDEHKEDILDEYLFYLFKCKVVNLKNLVGKKKFGTSLNSSFLKKVEIPIPDPDTQKAIISEMKKVDINLNESLISKLENEILTKYL